MNFFGVAWLYICTILLHYKERQLQRVSIGGWALVSFYYTWKHLMIRIYFSCDFL